MRDSLKRILYDPRLAITWAFVATLWFAATVGIRSANIFTAGLAAGLWVGLTIMEWPIINRDKRGAGDDAS